jgi:hypothetical protein
MTTTTNTTNTTPDFLQAPEALYIGSAPQAGVIYTWANRDGNVTQYMVPTGERLKNGKHVVRFIDIMDRGQRYAYKVKARTYMDPSWFAQWKRATTVPARVHAALVGV